MDERKLIECAVSGEAWAERKLYELHIDRVHRLAYRMTGDAHLAEDFTQESFVRAFQRLDRFEFRSRLSTWLHSITMTVVLNGMRKQRRTWQREYGTEDLEQLGGQGSHGDGAERYALRRDLHRAIDGLNDAMKAVFVMHDLEGYTHGEIAAVLGVEEGTSKARLSRARARLRESLSEHGSAGPTADQAAGEES